MDLEQLSSYFEKITKMFNPNDFNFLVLVFNFCIALIFLIIFYDLKPKRLFKDRKYLILFVLIIIIDFIMECIFGNIPLVIPILAIFIANIFFLLKDRELFNLLIKKNTDDEDNENEIENNTMDSKKEKSIKDLQYKINRLGKNSGFNIIDILYIYDYITDYQRRKVIQEMIYSDVDEMIKYLNKNPAVSDAELKEAKGILNLININGKILTKEEALLQLVDMNLRNNENSSSSTEDKRKGS